VIVVKKGSLKHELTTLCRARRRAPNLRALDCFLFGFGPLCLGGKSIRSVTVVEQPSTLLRFYDALV
jgi:hypothetical protein